MRPIRVAIIAALAVPAIAAGQDTLWIDLSSGIRQQTHPIGPGTFIVKIQNLIPSDGVRYTLSVRARDVLIGPLEMPEGVARAGREATRDSTEVALRDACAALRDALRDAYDALLTATSESNVPGETARVRNARRALEAGVDGESCGYGEGLPAERVDAALARTTYIVPRTFQVGDGQELEISVERPDSERWQYDYRTVNPRRWVASYGFAFSIRASREERFHTVAQDDGSFVIREDDPRANIGFTPAVLFRWVGGPDWQGFSLSGVGGLGLDITDPRPMLGLGLTWNTNIGLDVGVLAERLQKLRGRYTEGDVVKEQLEKELHDNVYRINPFVSISLRLGANPFSIGREAGEGGSGGGQ